MIRIAVHKALSDNIQAVQQRVYPLIMPQDTKKNSIVYRVISNADTVGISCTNPVDTAYFMQIDVFAHTYAQSVELMEEVKQVLRDNFIVSNMTSYEDYANITVKYRQIIDVQLRVKPVYGAAPIQPLPTHIVNHGNDVYNNGKLITN